MIFLGSLLQYKVIICVQCVQLAFNYLLSMIQTKFKTQCELNCPIILPAPYGNCNIHGTVYT